METGTLWSASDYAPTATRLAPVGPVVADALARHVPSPASVLEVGAGHGQLARLLTDRGYDVRALEPSARMLAIGSDQAPRATWINASVDGADLADDDYAAVVSSFGLMFADPSSALPRVRGALRPGGSLIMTAWAPEGFLHEMTQRMIRHLPHVAQAPHLAWGDPEVARERLAPHFDTVEVTEHTLPWTFASVEEGMDLYRNGSPTHAASFAMAGDQAPALEQELREHLTEHVGGDGAIRSETSYLLIVAH